MNVTEILVIAYDGKHAGLSAVLTPKFAKVVLSSADGNGEEVAKSAWEQDTHAFTDLLKLVEGLAVEPAGREA